LVAPVPSRRRRPLAVFLAAAHPPGAPSTPFQINPYVSELSLFDIAGTPGVATDLSHINSKAVVKVSRRRKGDDDGP
jgi:malate dehydrogenase